MKYDIILAGVGGQGILTIAYLLDNAAVNRGLSFKQAEVHGMAQRGGAVYSHMRISDQPVISDLIPEGSADMILSVEPLEVQRYLHFLQPRGVVVSNNQTFTNIPDYPAESDVIGALLNLKNAMVFNARKIALAARSPRSENVATVGVAVPFLPFDVADFQPILKELFQARGEQVVQANLDVLDMGHRAGLFYKGLLDKGVQNDLIYELVRHIDVKTTDPGLVNRFAEVLLARPDECRQALMRIEGDVPGDGSLLESLTQG